MPILLLEKDINAGQRRFEAIEKSLQRLKMYQWLDTIKVDTTNRSPNEIVARLCLLIPSVAKAGEVLCHIANSSKVC